MTIQDVEFLFSYNRWANARTLDAAAKLAPNALTRDHSTYHRGQVTTMLRQLGAQPVGTDLVAFLRA